MLLYAQLTITAIIIVFIVAEIMRPKLSKGQKNKYKKIIDKYRDEGYHAYITSIQTPESFFIYKDKRPDDIKGGIKIFIDCEKEVAFEARQLNSVYRKIVQPPIPFNEI
jgi:hypothetical protein